MPPLLLLCCVALEKWASLSEHGLFHGITDVPPSQAGMEGSQQCLEEVKCPEMAAIATLMVTTADALFSPQLRAVRRGAQSLLTGAALAGAGRPSVTEHRGSVSAGASGDNSGGSASRFRDLERTLCRAPGSDLLRVCPASWATLHPSMPRHHSQGVSDSHLRLPTPELISAPAAGNVNCIVSGHQQPKRRGNILLDPTSLCPMPGGLF